MVRQNNISLSILILVCISFLLISLFFVINLINISVIEESYQGNSDYVSKDVKIYKNQYGISYIIAPLLKDAIFGVGFAQASDRLWQMDYLRRVAYGKLSEILGPQAIKFDQYFRALGLKEISDRVYSNLDTKSKQILVAFSNGVNHYLEVYSNKLPIEFQTLAYKPELWRPQDCLAIGRLMAYSMSFSFWLDLTFFDIANSVGYEKAAILVPRKFENYEDFISDSGNITKRITSNNHVMENNFITTFSYFREEVEKFFPVGIFNVGSNTWAVRIIENDKKRGVLASDPHLKLSLPPIWYQVHITSDEFNVVGLVIPGTPLPLIGRNDYIAWGITNGMIDDCDFFVHQTDTSGKFIIDSTKKVRINYESDTIVVKNSPNFIYYKRFLGHDIIFSDFLLIKDSLISKDFYRIQNSPKLNKNICLTFKWTGQIVSDEIKTLYLICKSRNWKEFTNAKTYWGAPVLNFSYADKFGNIGLMLAGLIPERLDGECVFPKELSSKKNHWIGYKRLGEDFNLYNPSEGFVLNANNKTFKSNINLGHYWSDPSRAFRILQMLTTLKPEDIYSIQLMQKDQTSEQSKFVLSIVLPILNSKRVYLDSIENKSLDILNTWNNSFDINSVASSIYQIFLFKFLENTLKDELGDPLFRQYLYLDFIAARKFLEFISDSSNVFFDNVRTVNFEQKEDIILMSFKDAIKKLRNLFGTENILGYKYGRWHKLVLEHPFSKINFLNPTFSVGEIPIGGNNSTINYAGSKLFELSEVEVGPSTRFIADMADTLVWWILPGGNSGQAMSKNYTDQLHLWLSGGYISISIGKTPDPRFRLFAVISGKSKN